MKRVFKVSQGIVRAILGLCLATSIIFTGVHLLAWTGGSDLDPAWMAYVVVIGALVGCHLVVSWTVGGFKR